MKDDKTQIKNAASGKPRKKMSTLKKVLLIGGAVLLAAVLFYAGRLVYFMLNPSAAFQHTAGEVISEEPSPEESDVASAEPSPSQTPSETVTPTPTPTPSVDPDEAMLSQADLDFIKNRTNILLIGIDENPARDQTDRKDFRTDVMMLLSIDFENKTVHVLSVPRDSYTDIYGTNERWKLNGAFMKGGGFTGDGFEYTLKSVSMCLGLDKVPIQLYCAVQMYGLRDLIDALGGVDYKVDVNATLNGRKIKKGMQHLTGQQVLDYVRVRKGIGTGTDIGRTDRQQKLMLALFTQLQKADKLTLIPKAFQAMKDQIWTNLSMEEIVALVVFAKDLDPENIKRYHIDGTYMRAYNAKYYVLHQSSIKDVVSKIYGIDRSHIKLSIRYDYSYVSADMAAQSALDSAAKFQKKYKSKMTPEEAGSLSDKIASVKSAKKKLPSGMSALKTASKELTSLCYSIEKAIKEREAPPPSPSPSPSETQPPAAS
jgi:LCP family protein required for cell wall assembly